jgi:hypothetical protein
MNSHNDDVDNQVWVIEGLLEVDSSSERCSWIADMTATFFDFLSVRKCMQDDDYTPVVVGCCMCCGAAIASIHACPFAAVTAMSHTSAGTASGLSTANVSAAINTSAQASSSSVQIIQPNYCGLCQTQPAYQINTPVDPNCCSLCQIGPISTPPNPNCCNFPIAFAPIQSVAANNTICQTCCLPTCGYNTCSCCPLCPCRLPCCSPETVYCSGAECMEYAISACLVFNVNQFMECCCNDITPETTAQEQFTIDANNQSTALVCYTSPSRPQRNGMGRYVYRKKPEESYMVYAKTPDRAVFSKEKSYEPPAIHLASDDHIFGIPGIFTNDCFLKSEEKRDNIHYSHELKESQSLEQKKSILSRLEAEVNDGFGVLPERDYDMTASLSVNGHFSQFNEVESTTSMKNIDDIFKPQKFFDELFALTDAALDECLEAKICTDNESFSTERYFHFYNSPAIATVSEDKILDEESSVSASIVEVRETDHLVSSPDLPVFSKSVSSFEPIKPSRESSPSSNYLPSIVEPLNLSITSPNSVSINTVAIQDSLPFPIRLPSHSFSKSPVASSSVSPLTLAMPVAVIRPASVSDPTVLLYNSVNRVSLPPPPPPLYLLMRNGHLPFDSENRETISSSKDTTVSFKVQLLKGPRGLGIDIECDDTGRARIRYVKDFSPALTSNPPLLAGDIIVAVNSTATSLLDDVMREIRAVSVNSAILIGIERNSGMNEKIWNSDDEVDLT